jgi:hypothetical protein
MAQRTAKSGRHPAFDRTRVTQLVRDMAPAKRGVAYVVVNGRRYPARKVAAAASGMSLSHVSTATALDALGRLGFVTGDGRHPLSILMERRRSNLAARQTAAGDDELDRRLREHIGEWVAVRDGRLLVAAPDAATVIAWLKERDESAEAMFKVPRDLTEISGTAA